MKKFLLSTLENSRKYTLDVASAMPENAYSSKMTADTWSFGELLSHIAYGIYWWEQNFVKGVKVEWTSPAAPTSKKEIVDALTTAYDSLRKTIETSPVDDEVTKGFFMTIDHITHHRGQAVIHLRKQGVVPPDYIF